MNLKCRLIAAVLASTGFAAQAAEQNAVSEFVQAPGFETLAVEPLWERVQSALPAPPAASIQRPAANLAPAALAALALDTAETALPRQRHRVRYGVVSQPGTAAGAPVSVSLIEVARFNLGPASRQALIEQLGEDQVAPPEDFGVGPHVVWRLATQPLRGNRAVVIAASRQVLDDDAATAMTCFDQSCLTPDGVIAEVAPWPEPREIRLAAEAAALAGPDGWPTAAAALQVLQGDNDIDESEGAESGQAPRLMPIEAVVEQGLGQDDGMDAAWHHGGLLDDSVTAQWQRLMTFRGADGKAAVAGSTLWECARGDDRFAPPGQYCP